MRVFEGDAMKLSRDLHLLGALRGFGIETVVHHDLGARPEEGLGHVRTDEADAARYKNGAGVFLGVNGSVMMRGGLGGHGENYVSPIERSISRLTIST
jgi:hypothetical protein